MSPKTKVILQMILDRETNDSSSKEPTNTSEEFDLAKVWPLGFSDNAFGYAGLRVILPIQPNHQFVDAIEPRCSIGGLSAQVLRFFVTPRSITFEVQLPDGLTLTRRITCIELTWLNPQAYALAG